MVVDHLPALPKLTARKAFSALCGGGATLFPGSQIADAAGVTYDFAYRLERSLDPDKRGPATGEIEPPDDVSADFMSAMDAMCSPTPPQEVSDAASSPATMQQTTDFGSALLKPTSASVAAAAAAASSSPPEPAASIEPGAFLMEHATANIGGLLLVADGDAGGPLELIRDNFALEAAWLAFIGLAIVSVALNPPK